MLLRKIIIFLSSVFNIKEDIVQEETQKNILNGIAFKGENVWILICSIFIACIGLNNNSTSVIIGAMLISPLMGPGLGLGYALAVYDDNTLRQAIKNLLIMMGISVLTSTLYFLIFPVNATYTSELEARVNPTILDIFVAIFGGIAGIISLSKKNKNTNVISGVAIATALMPPLCTTGYGIATFQLKYILGPLYLFTLNCIFICLSTWLFLNYIQVTKINFLDEAQKKKVKKYIIFSISIIIIPSAFIFVKITRESIFKTNSNTFIANICQYEGSYSYSHKAIFGEDKTIIVYFSGKHIPKDIIEQWKKRLQDYNLENTILDIRQDDDYSAKIDEAKKDLKNEFFGHLYKDKEHKLQLNQQQIQDLQQTIIQLKSKYIDIDTKAIREEIHILFPEVKKLHIGTLTEVNIKDNTVDTINVYSIIVEQNTPYYDATRIDNWIKLKLGHSNIKNIIIEKL